MIPLKQHYFELLLYIIMLHMLPQKLASRRNFPPKTFRQKLKLSGKNRYFPAKIDTFRRTPEIYDSFRQIPRKYTEKCREVFPRGE
jgi:hypothetical protein